MKKALSSVLLLLVLTICSVPAVSQAAPWEPCYGGLLRCDESGIIWQSDSVAPNSQLAQLASTDGLEQFLSKIGVFMNNILIPLLFAIALLFFLFNIARYFIIEAASSDKKAEAKRSAIYGIAALVFIVSIWGIVNLLVNGLVIGRAESICPDYILKAGGDCGNIGTETGASNVNFGNPSNFGSGGSESTSGSGSLPENPEKVFSSALGVLLYGDLEDSANFNFRAGVPRAQTNTVAIPTLASCADGLNALALAARVENVQASYYMYKENGSTRFVNLTDIHSATSIDIDADTINGIASSSKEVIIHTHPQKVTAQSGLALAGRAPSRADMELLCDNAPNTYEYLVLDGTTVWSMKKTPNSCPRNALEADNLLLIDTLLQLSLLDGATRQAQFEDLLKDVETPSLLRSSLASYTNTSFASLSSQSVFLMADDLARAGRMQITKYSVANYCAGY